MFLRVVELFASHVNIKLSLGRLNMWNGKVWNILFLLEAFYFKNSIMQFVFKIYLKKSNVFSYRRIYFDFPW